MTGGSVPVAMSSTSAAPMAAMPAMSQRVGVAAASTPASVAHASATSAAPASPPAVSGASAATANSPSASPPPAARGPSTRAAGSAASGGTARTASQAKAPPVAGRALMAAVLKSSDAGGTRAHQRLRRRAGTDAAAGVGRRIVAAWMPQRTRIAGRSWVDVTPPGLPAAVPKSSKSS